MLAKPAKDRRPGQQTPRPRVNPPATHFDDGPIPGCAGNEAGGGSYGGIEIQNTERDGLEQHGFGKCSLNREYR